MPRQPRGPIAKMDEIGLAIAFDMERQACGAYGLALGQGRLRLDEPAVVLGRDSSR